MAQSSWIPAVCADVRRPAVSGGCRCRGQGPPVPGTGLAAVALQALARAQQNCKHEGRYAGPGRRLGRGRPVRSERELDVPARVAALVPGVRRERGARRAAAGPVGPGRATAAGRPGRGRRQRRRRTGDATAGAEGAEADAAAAAGARRAPRTAAIPRKLLARRHPGAAGRGARRGRRRRRGDLGRPLWQLAPGGHRWPRPAHRVGPAGRPLPPLRLREAPGRRQGAAAAHGVAQDAAAQAAAPRGGRHRQPAGPGRGHHAAAHARPQLRRRVPDRTDVAVAVPSSVVAGGQGDAVAVP